MLNQISVEGASNGPKVREVGTDLVSAMGYSIVVIVIVIQGIYKSGY